MLMALLDDDDVKHYHRALICGLLANHGDPDDFNIGEYAQQCIDLCYEIIQVEALVPQSNARQTFEDLIHGARVVLNQLNFMELEKQQYQDLQDSLKDGGTVEGDQWSDETEMDADCEPEEQYDDAAGTAGRDFDTRREEYNESYSNNLGQMDEDYDVTSDEEEVAVAEGDEEEEEEDEEDDDDTEADVTQKQQKQQVFLDISTSRSSDPQALENRITAAPGHEIQHQNQGDGAFFESEVEIEDARLIQAFVLLILEYGHPCRNDMQIILDRYATEKKVEKERFIEHMNSIQLELGGLVIRTCLIPRKHLA